MKHHFLILSFIIWGTITSTQAQVGFNKMLQTSYRQLACTDMLIKNDTILLYGIGIFDTITQQQGLFLFKMDTLGNILQEKIFLDSAGSKLTLDPRFCHFSLTNDGGILMAAVVRSRRNGIIYKLNWDFEVVMQREFTEDTDFTDIITTCIEIENGYLVSGFIQRPNYLTDWFVRKTDTAGNTLWLKYYGIYSVDETLYDMKRVNDSLYVLVGFQSVNTPYKEKSWIMYMDDNGNVLKSWHSSGDISPIGITLRILESTQESILVYGRKIVTPYPPPPGSSTLARATISRLDSSFNVQHSKSFGRSDAVNQVYDITPTQDGNYIAVGKSWTYLDNGAVAYHNGRIEKITPEADSIWSRRDSAHVPYTQYMEHAFSGVDVLSSGSIIAAGYVLSNALYSSWIVKVSPDGCIDTLGCHAVSTQEVPVPAAITAGLLCWPNPAHDRLTLQLPEGFRAVRLAVYDVHGRQCLSQPLDPLDSQAEIAVGKWPAGLYVAVVSDGKGKEERGRFFRL